MMFTQNNYAVPRPHSRGIAPLMPLLRVLLMVSLSIGTSIPVYGDSIGAPPAMTDLPAPSTNTTEISSPTAGNSPQPFVETTQTKPSMEWISLTNILLLIILAIIVMAVFYQLLRLDRITSELKEKVDNFNKKLKQYVQAELSALTNKQNTQRGQVNNENDDLLKSLYQQVNKLQSEVIQLKQLVQQPQARLEKNSSQPDDIPTLTPEVSISKAPPIQINADDREKIRQALDGWLQNILTSQFEDHLPKELIEKIDFLGYKIVFAKAGQGLNRMIIDRKPPNKSCMVGLEGLEASLMYCFKKTSQTDDQWHPNTWYEVSIDNSNAEEEQEVHQNGEART